MILSNTMFVSKFLLIFFFCRTACGQDVSEINTTFLDLSELIRQGEIEKAQNLSRVEPALFAGVRSHAAYITVNEDRRWHRFFWYFPVEDKPVHSTPWIIWFENYLYSALHGMYNQIGPLQFTNKDKATRMPTTWGSDYSLLFVDCSLQTGFSFTGKTYDQLRTEEQVAEYSLIFLHQFMVLFPELQKAPLFIAGNRWGAKIAVQLGYEIHTNWNKSIGLNFKGLILDNAQIDLLNMQYYAELSYQLGYIDDKNAQLGAEIERKGRAACDLGNLNACRMYFHWAGVRTFNHQTYFNIMRDYEEYHATDKPSRDYLSREDVRTALHAGKTYSECTFVYTYTLPSAKDIFEVLLDNYAVLSYNGQLNYYDGYPLAEHMYQTLNWTGRETYLKAKRTPILSKTPNLTLNPIGYSKKAGKFEEVMIRTAGVFPGRDQPLATKQIVDAFIDQYK